MSEDVTARRALLDHARGFVSVADIETCAIAIDPGYPAYVDELTSVQARGSDAVASVEWEVIFHALHDDPDTMADLDQFRRYRMFIAALASFHPMLGELIAPSDVAISLVEDACALSDAAWFALAYAALDELVVALRANHDLAVPFVVLGSLLVASAARRSDDELSALALRVFDDEAEYTRRSVAVSLHGRPPRSAQQKPTRDTTFLWGSCTSANPANRWTRAVAQHLPCSTQSLASLRTVLLRTLTAV